MRIPRLKAALILFLICAAILPGQTQTVDTNQPPAWLSHPISLADALNLALQQNGNILKGKSDLEAQYGVVVQTRAVAIPKVQLTGNYQATTATEQFPFPNPPPAQDQTWNGNI